MWKIGSKMDREVCSIIDDLRKLPAGSFFKRADRINESEGEARMEKLKTGEKWLSVSVLGGKSIACFKNKNKKNPKEPDWRGNGVAIWVNEKRGASENQETAGI